MTGLVTVRPTERGAGDLTSPVDDNSSATIPPAGACDRIEMSRGYSHPSPAGTVWQHVSEIYFLFPDYIIG